LRLNSKVIELGNQLAMRSSLAGALQRAWREKIFVRNGQISAENEDMSQKAPNISQEGIVARAL